MRSCRSSGRRWLRTGRADGRDGPWPRDAGAEDRPRAGLTGSPGRFRGMHKPCTSHARSMHGAAAPSVSACRWPARVSTCHDSGRPFASACARLTAPDWSPATMPRDRPVQHTGKPPCTEKVSSRLSRRSPGRSGDGARPNPRRAASVKPLRCCPRRRTDGRPGAGRCDRASRTGGCRGRAFDRSGDDRGGRRDAAPRFRLPSMRDRGRGARTGLDGGAPGRAGSPPNSEGEERQCATVGSFWSRASSRSGRRRASGCRARAISRCSTRCTTAAGGSTLVLCRNEGGAAFMAAAWGKLTGAPGICFVTRGPGVTNASIGIHTAMQDSVADDRLRRPGRHRHARARGLPGDRLSRGLRVDGEMGGRDRRRRPRSPRSWRAPGRRRRRAGRGRW